MPSTIDYRWYFVILLLEASLEQRPSTDTTKGGEEKGQHPDLPSHPEPRKDSIR